MSDSKGGKYYILPEGEAVFYLVKSSYSVRVKTLISFLIVSFIFIFSIILIYVSAIPSDVKFVVGFVVGLIGMKPLIRYFVSFLLVIKKKNSHISREFKITEN